MPIVVGQSLRGSDVVAALEEIKLFRGLVPQRIQTDNGTEFISKEMDKWAYDNQVTMDYSRPGHIFIIYGATKYGVRAYHLN